MKNIEVNKNLCIGCGACVAICPQNFDFDDDGLSTVINDTVTKEAVEASEVCPVYAIKINTAIEKNTEKNVKSEEKCACECDSKENKESEEEKENDDSECCGGCHCCNGTCCEGC